MAEDFFSTTDAYMKNWKESEKYRGEIISTAILVERIIEQFLSVFFCGSNHEKRIALLDTILCGTLTLSKKIKIATTLLKEKDDEQLESIKPMLNRIKDLRNAVAHHDWYSVIDSQGSSKNENGVTITFRNTYGNKSSIHINHITLYELKRDAMQCVEYFVSEINKIKSPS